MSKNRQMIMERGAARHVHFSQGGTLAEWRGRAVTMGDRKHRANKVACRGRVQEAGR